MTNYQDTTVEEVLAALNTSLHGLSGEEAALRRAKTGLNKLEESPPISARKILLNQFSSFIIYFLLFAVAFSIIIGEYPDSLVILAILIMNGLIGFSQELRANRSLDRPPSIRSLHLGSFKISHNCSM